MKELDVDHEMVEAILYALFVTVKVDMILVTSMKERGAEQEVFEGVASPLCFKSRKKERRSPYNKRKQVRHQDLLRPTSSNIRCEVSNVSVAS